MTAAAKSGGVDREQLQPPRGPRPVLQTCSLPEFFRTDNPPVRDGGVDGRTCAMCRFWSRWLPETGDCLLYALKRQDAVIAGNADEMPRKAARVTSAGELCDGWQEREGRGLSR